MGHSGQSREWEQEAGAEVPAGKAAGLDLGVAVGGGADGKLFSTAGALDSLKVGRGRLMAQASLGEGAGGTS